MRGLFFKIFIIFWIAQSLIFVLSMALIVHRHFGGPDVLYDVVRSTIEREAQLTANAYETGGCAAVSTYASNISQTIALATASGEPLCSPQGMAQLSAQEFAQLPPHVEGRIVDRQYIWTVPVHSASGKSYVYLLCRLHLPHRPSLWEDLLHFSTPQLPVAIVIGGFTTFVLGFLFTRPVMQLRRVARSLARGKLDERVRLTGPEGAFFKGDEVAGLILDFNHMAERLEQLVGAQKLLLRDVSHELRSPLARLSVALELAREDASEPMGAHLDRIERETVRLNQLIGQLLTLSSMEALERQKHFGRLNLNQLVEKLIPDSEYEARQRECGVVFHAAEECFIEGNEELLYRAIENVVRNAIRYTDPGTEVEVSLRTAVEHGERRVELNVSDHGPGIPEDQQQAIFRPFYRVDDARSPSTGGFGVGLAIADRAVRLHGGELSAHNRAEGGATMRMSFPAAKQMA
ncbi:sensor histidine kinase [Telmatobacter bradus]|uniref:sensor histidine kinase n=1 Tax=Telmatobacter bradus TaxID=474953 RepID=UPI003B430549